MSSRKLFLRLLRDCLYHRTRLSVAIAAVGLLGLTQLYLTWLVKRWLEGPLVNADRAALLQITVEAAGVMAVGAAALFLSRYRITSVNQEAVERLRNRAIERLLALDVARARQLATGDVLSRLLADAGTLSGFLATIVRRCIRETFVAVGALTMLFVLNWRLALAMCLLVPVTWILLVRFGSCIRRWQTLASVETGALGAIANEQLQGFSTVKIFTAEQAELRRFATQNSSCRRKVIQAELWSALLISLVFFSTGLGLVAMAWYGTTTLAADITPGTLLAFCLYAGQTVEPLRRLSELHGFLQGTLAAAGRVYELIDLPIAEVDAAALPLPVPVRGEVQFEAVSFAYPNGELVLRNVSLSIRPGEHVALVGPTGSGKTTLAGLLVTLNETRSGQIRLDGMALAGTRRADLRRAVCLVEQEPFLFSGPLIENVRYGAPGASLQSANAAMQLVGLDLLLAAAPGDLFTQLVEGGRQLSGGERQRIALARAILRAPAVLILDEATSAIDSETEGAIFARLESWLARRTVIAIGHRLSTISRYERVLMLHDGQIVGDGPVGELQRNCMPFWNLFADQIEGRAVRLPAYAGSPGSIAAQSPGLGFNPAPGP